MDTKATNPKDAIAGTKVPLWLCSPIAMAHWAVAQFVGMAKYGAWNFRVSGVRSSVYTSAIKRHVDAYLSGEDYDPDGQHNLGAIMACCAIILEAEAAGNLTDDRPPTTAPLRELYGKLEKTIAAIAERNKDKNPTHYTIAGPEEK